MFVNGSKEIKRKMLQFAARKILLAFQRQNKTQTVVYVFVFNI